MIDPKELIDELYSFVVCIPGWIRLALYRSRRSLPPPKARLIVKETAAALAGRGSGFFPHHVNCRCKLIGTDGVRISTPFNIDELKMQDVIEEFEKYRWRPTPEFDVVAALEGNIKKVDTKGLGGYERYWFFDRG